MRDEQGLPEDGIEGIDEQDPDAGAGAAGPVEPTRPLGQAVITAPPVEVTGLCSDVTMCDLA